MIKVAVRKNDCGGPSILPEASFGSVSYCGLGSDDSRIDKNPVSIARAPLPHENDISDQAPQIAEVREYLETSVTSVAAVRDCLIGDSNLMSHVNSRFAELKFRKI
jgi:hypothetical protein